MQRHLTVAALGALLCIPAAAQRPSDEEQRHAIETAREIAVQYTGKLPDFICTEQVERANRTIPSSTIPAGFEGAVRADKLTIQLSYFERKEEQKLVAINGNQTHKPLDSLEGLITGGEFGSLLRGIFDPSSAADFQWKETANLLQRKANVYTYRIARAHSHYIVGYRGDGGNWLQLAAGYQGEVSLDAETSHVLRLTASADDIPKESGIVQSAVEVDYDYIDVAGHTYLLPAHSKSRMLRGHRQISNVVTYTDYHKFQAESTIDLGKR
jgi:hypothetical protein